MLIGWMPYLRIAYPSGSRELRVGQARFIPDDDKAWTEVVGCTRPGHFDLFHEFPSINSTQLGDPARGTLILADDPKWLLQFADEAVATVYFLGDKQSGWPAECFAYHLMNLREDGGSQNFAQFRTKHTTLIETGTSTAINPPLMTRGYSHEYRLNVVRAASVNLLYMIEDDPMHRIVVAVRQYFRTQLSDTFSSTPAEDVATFCSCLEAAFDLDGRRDAGDRFVDAMCGVFGKDLWLREFFFGLYAARSYYVHGVPEDAAAESAKMEAVAYRSFLARPWKLSLLRQIARWVLLVHLGELPSVYGFELPDSPTVLLNKVLRSDATWEACRRALAHRGAADSIDKMSVEEFHAIEELAVAMKEQFAWECALEPFEVGAVYRSICTCAILIGRITGSTGPVYEASDAVGKAADKRDATAIRDWCFKYANWVDIVVFPKDRLRTMQAMLWALSNHFVVRG